MPKAKKNPVKSKASPTSASKAPAGTSKKPRAVKAKTAGTAKNVAQVPSIKKSSVSTGVFAEPVVPIRPVSPRLAPARTIEVAAAPMAATCPLVLDGEILANSFSPKNCLSCDEFDCRFCLTEEGSGDLMSLLGDDDVEDEGDVEGFSFDRESGGRDDWGDESSEDDY